MPAKRTYDVDTIIISNRMSEREQKIFTLLKEGREYKFIAKQFNLASSDIGKIVRKYLSNFTTFHFVRKTKKNTTNN